MDKKPERRPKTLPFNERVGTIVAILLGMMCACMILCVFVVIWGF
ncbi:MAG: hypothetical protein BroJett018_11670 [Chloroflexota bacterium]|nr:MAG: hypothetical protein BroJett018_11670 [Chloroflexota bacterium]